MELLTNRFLLWRQLLEQIIKDLDALIQKSEKIFQAFATGHEDIKKSNDDCVDSTTLVIQRIEAQQGLDLSLLADLHSSISASVNNTLSDITRSLGSLMGKVAEIQDLKFTLEEVSYSIKNVSLLMKIKTTKMGKSEFDHVVKGLESLSRQIKENTEGISAATHEASENITLTCEQIDDRLDRFNRLIKPSRDQIKELLLEFGDIALTTQNRCRQIKTLSGLSHQKIETFQKTAALLARFLKEMQNVRQALNGAVSVLSVVTGEDSDGYKAIQQVVETTTLQIGHIGQWNREIETGGNLLQKNLKHLLQTAEEQIDEAKTMTENVAESRKKMVIFENDFNSISTTTFFSEEKTRELLEAISSINGNIYNVSRQVSQIDIGRNDLEALTYNAVFKAAKVGMQGKVMASITDEITALSREVQSKVTDKEAVIKSIVASSKEFKGSLSEKLNQQLDFSKEVNLKIRDQSRKFMDDAESVATVFEKTKQFGETIQQTLTNELFDQPLNDRLTKIQTRMSDMLAEMQQPSE